MDSLEKYPPQSAHPQDMVPVLPSEGRSEREFALAVLLIGAFLPPLDFYIVNLALPAIQGGLRTTGGQLQLIISGYARLMRFS
jgi:hypothetical protein